MTDLQSYSTFTSLINERYSCRAYDSDRTLDHELIKSVIEAARIAPSACNRQPWNFLVLESDEAREIIAQSYDRDWIRTAPAYIIALGDHSQAWHRAYDGKDHTDIDLAIAIEHICIAAASLGLGTCWVCNFDPAVITKAYNLPDNIEPIAIIPIGYPAANSIRPAKNRKNADEIIKWGKY